MYNFVTRLGLQCELFDVEPFASSFQNCGEMIMTSDSFENYEACVVAAQQFLTTLSNLLTQVTKKKYVVMSKINPTYNPNSEDNGSEVWSPHTEVRLYLAEAKMVKKKQLVFTIHTNINVAEDFIAISNSLTPSATQ